MYASENLTQRTIGETVFSLSQNSQNCSAAHSIGNELFAEVRRPERAPCSRLRMSETVPLLPLYGRTASTRTTLSFLNFKQIVTLQCLPPRSFFLLFSAAFVSVPSSLLSRLFSLFLYGVLPYLLSFVVSFNSLHPSQVFFLPYFSIFILPPILAK